MILNPEKPGWAKIGKNEGPSTSLLEDKCTFEIHRYVPFLLSRLYVDISSG